MSMEESMNTLSAALNRHADVLEATIAATQGATVKTTDKTVAAEPKKPTAAEIKKQKAADAKVAKEAKAAEDEAAAAALLDDDADIAISKDDLTALVKDCIKLKKQAEAIAVMTNRGYKKLSEIPETEYAEVHEELTQIKEA